MQQINDYGIELTDQAVKRIKELQLLEHNEQLMLRVSVNGGGCSGFQYKFDLTETINSDDLILSKDEVKVLVDPLSYDFMRNSTIEFLEDLTGSAFTIKNPNATAKCGCGSSFSIDLM